MSGELSLSIDLDGIHHHLRGYGQAAERPEANVIYEKAVPRYLDLFAKLDVRATFFSIAEDAPDHADVLRAAVAAGHEIGSHSLTHPLPFDALDDTALEREVSGSRETLEDALETPVCGFRAPGFSISPRVLHQVRRAGYAYDSSVFPSPAYLAALLSMKRRLGGRVRIRPLRALRYALSRRLPARRDGLWEIPLSVTPWIRMPYYQTLDPVLGRALFDRLTRYMAGRSEPLHYTLHGIDLVAPGEMDERLLHHPGASAPLDEKTGRMAETLAVLLRSHRNVRLCDRYAAEAA
jgi:peptidoglycan/xylan/chitin deacetylase (PgdA/CDA1 family)